MGKELLFEIGTEEIPSGYLPPALEELKAVAGRLLQEHRLTFAGIRTLGTPRRLTLCVDGLAEKQADARREVIGPTRAVAYDAQGKPTRAAEGFARAQGVPVERLEVRALDRGEYMMAVQEERGAATPQVLLTLLPKVLTSLSFPKFMRWGDGTFRFVRPVRWLLCLYGGKVVPVAIEGLNLKADAKTYGHRFLSPRGVRVRSFQEYLETLEEKFVIVDQDRRREIVRKLAVEAAATVKGQVVLDDDLVETVTHLVEFPTVVCGSFRPEYLELPRDVIITPMRKHQRYFPVVDAAGNLLPHFVAISNMRARDMELIRQGNERVLRARLNDAEFFYRDDRKVPLAERVGRLRDIIFQEKLGTMHDKVQRVRELAAFIADRVDPACRAGAERAAHLCKADLVTTMVKEFPNLQGTMGREYARLSGEPPEVCQAIEEHYLPRSAGDRLAASNAGAVVGLADRLDSIVGCFGVGLMPTGSEDPYALRRAALGVVQTILHRGFQASLGELVDRARAAFGGRLDQAADKIRREVLDFLRGRIQVVLVDRGLPPEVVEAVLAAGFDDVADAARRAEALAVMRREADFGELSAAFRRVVGIIPRGFDRPVDAARLVEGAERALHAQVIALKAEVDGKVAAHDYLGALQRIAGLKPMVDMFFEEVLVIGPDEGLTQNRFALLKAVGDLFARIADFTKITG
ncbi:MAG: glycine--tRNA ligase subunit beta [candidate division NC10 bacterium]|nr:glycine--tRNA ligase subunit beta [candidate division NC10 bacterium]